MLKMEMQTESLLEKSEEAELERELNLLIETTLRLEYELESVVKLKDF